MSHLSSLCINFHARSLNTRRDFRYINESNNKQNRIAMKNLRILKKLSLVGAAALGLLVMAPTTSSAADANATLHVIVNVVNSYGGTAVPADFTLHIRYLMKEVTGSPFNGASGAGTTFSLAPGSYLITENDSPVSGGYVTYYGNYSGTNINEGFVTLAAGEEVTITRTEYDWPLAGPAVAQPTASPIPTTPTTTPAPATPATQVGGTLPKTASPWYNMLAVSIGLVLIGGFGFRVRKAVK